MRSLLFVLDMVCLLPVAMGRPFVGVLLWDWIAFMNPHKLVWGFGVNWPWALASFVVTILGWAFSRQEPKRLAVNPTTVLMMLFLVGITINLPFALSPWPVEYDRWLRVLKMFVFFIVTASLLTDKRRIDALVWIIAISMGFWVLYQGGAAVVTLGNHKAFGPPDSMIGDNNIFAAAMLVVMPLFNYLRLQSRYRFMRVGLAFMVGLTFLAVLASYSRGAFLGILATTLVLWWRGRHKFVGLIVLGTTLVAAIMFMPPDWAARMHTIINHSDNPHTSAGSRLYIWNVAWQLALHHPLTGAGFRATLFPQIVETVVPSTQVLAIHSIWFEVLGQLGFPTFFVWVGITLVGVWNTRHIMQLTRDRPDLQWAQDLARMVQVSIVAYTVTGTFLPIAYWDIYFTVLVALAATHGLVMRAVQKTPRQIVQSRVRQGWHAARPTPPAPPVGAGRLARLPAGDGHR